MSTNVIQVATQAYDDQKPGTSGLRKRVNVFQQSNYTENFIQAILEAASSPKSLVVGGDGRYYSQDAIAKIVNIAAANGVERLLLAQNGILSTPAASALIRSEKADGGIVLTASHNPGGPNGDFGIKYNISNGGPAPQQVTDKIYMTAKSLSSYKCLLKRPSFDPSKLGESQVAQMKVEVFDSVENYQRLLETLFDFDKIKNLFEAKKVKIIADSMNGVMGPYAKKILVDALGAPEDSVINLTPMPDFGGKHPDPNLTYAKDLVEKLKADSSVDLGVAFDGDGDRNMILGKEAFFVTPGDSLAVIAANLDKIKQFKVNGYGGFARSFPTAPAIDRVAKKLGVKCYETPTGWKFFGNLMDSNFISICGEESFGTGSNHVREKDGLWACLAWLSIMAETGKGVKELVEDHWKTYGRDYFSRYDFEDCDATKCNAMMSELETLFGGKTLYGRKYGDYVVESTGNFAYTDPVDKSVTTKQGLYIKFTNGARIIFRLSGTGSQGATVRLYVSDYVDPKQTEKLFVRESSEYLKNLLDVAYEVSQLPKYTGMDKPTVIT